MTNSNMLLIALLIALHATSYLGVNEVNYETVARYRRERNCHSFIDSRIIDGLNALAVAAIT